MRREGVVDGGRVLVCAGRGSLDSCGLAAEPVLLQLVILLQQQVPLLICGRVTAVPQADMREAAG